MIRLGRIRIFGLVALMAGCPSREPQQGDSSTDNRGNHADDKGSASDPAVHPSSDPKPNGPATNGNLAKSVPGDVAPTPPDATPAADDVRGWLARLGSTDARILREASEHFSAQGDQATAIFFEHANDKSADVRRGAIYGLYSRFDPANEQMVPVFQNALADEDGAIRHIALQAINKLRQRAFVDAIPQLVLFLDPQREDAAVRAQVARMLKRRGTASQAALPALNRGVQSDPDYRSRLACLDAIYDIARNAEEAFPAPLYALRNDKDPRMRRKAAEQLGKYGPSAAEAVPRLVAALSDQGVPQRAADDPLRGKDEPVCVAAASALANIGGPAVAPLVQQLSGEDRTVRVLAIRALGQMGSGAEAATPALKKLANDEDSAISTAAKTALVQIAGRP